MRNSEGNNKTEVIIMEVQLLEKEDSKMKVKIVGEGHAFANVLRKKLHEEKDVDLAAYNIDHPLLSDPVLKVGTSGERNPKEVLVDVSSKLGKEYEEVQMKLKKALEQ